MRQQIIHIYFTNLFFVLNDASVLFSVPPPCKQKNPCVNGVCEDISAVDYRCKCNPGWIGKNCDGII